MSDKYLEIAKNYILENPQYLSDQEQLRFQLKIIGIPEKEINKIANDLIKNYQVNNSAGHKSWPRHTILFLILYLIAIAGMLAYILFVPSSKKKTQVTYVIPNQAQESRPFLPEIPSGGVEKKVYANELPVKMEQVFSYPVKNIDLGPSIRPKREVDGFIPYWAMDSFDKLNVDEITSANIFGIEPDGQGNIIITDSKGQEDGGWAMWNDPRLPKYIDTLKKKQVKVNIVVKMFSNGHMDSLLSSPDAQQKLISNIVYMVGSRNLDGVNLDFEYVGNVPDSTRQGFTSFVSSLHSQLVNEFPSATLTIDTYASSGVSSDLFDLPTLAHVIDAFIIMGYDFHTPYTAPGPVAPLTGEQSIVSYLANYLARVPPDKIILGVPYYGYDWLISDPTPNSTGILSYADVLGVSGPSNIQWDVDSQTPWYQYLDANKNTHKVFFDNVRSLGLKYDLVNDRNLKGIAVWAVGYDGNHQELNQLISQKFGY